MRKHRDAYSLRLIEELYNHIPAFNDVFDEETWYIFVICFVASTIVLVIIVSRFITIKPIDW